MNLNSGVLRVVVLSIHADYHKCKKYSYEGTFCIVVALSCSDTF